MKNVMKHTLTPWTLNKKATHPWVVEAPSNIPGIPAEIVRVGYRPNATFIVRAVNVHNDLLISAKEALCWLDPNGKLDGETPNEDRSDKENVIIGLYEAIAKAEEV